MTLLSIVVPLKDEEANVRPLYERVCAALGGEGPWELVLVDDGSTDGTFAELERLAAADSRVKVIRLRRNYGQSAAMQAGLDAATGRIVATMDGDLQNDPADIPHMLRKLEEGYDVVLGQRVHRQDGLVVRKLPSWVANWLIRRVLRVPFRDFGCTLRLMRREALEGITLYGEMHRFLTALLVLQGGNVTQMPVQHHPRTAGRSKYTLSRTFRVLLDLLTVKFQGSFQTRPMHLFGTLGLICLLLGTTGIGVAAVMKYTTGPGMTANPLFLLGAVTDLIGIQFLSLGLMGEVLTRVYYESQGKRPYLVRESRNLSAAPRNDNGLHRQAA
ncbi:MAG: glycosyltransferase family 2 protein [Gemmataceae bacterium]|nr:glycosyltransferase family 2 protein [Gemmataceae bacterium]MDW8244699.1 glycosyltransferase family 2 protein [Thermogemmata sp.]